MASPYDIADRKAERNRRVRRGNASKTGGGERRYRRSPGLRHETPNPAAALPLVPDMSPRGGVVTAQRASDDDLGNVTPLSLAPPEQLTCSPTVLPPSEVEALVEGHVRGDSWPNRDMRCAAHYWGYAGLGRSYAGRLDSDPDDSVYRQLRSGGDAGALAECCRPVDRGGIFRHRSLYAKMNSTFPRILEPTRVVPAHYGAYDVSLELDALCPPTLSVAQNPMAYSFHSPRWFNACPGNIFAQYTNHRLVTNNAPTRCQGAGCMKHYPFSLQNPFLYQWDWVLGPFGAGDAKWRDLGGVDGLRQQPRQVKLYVQRTVPRTVYCVKGLPFADVLERLLRLLAHRGLRVVVYVGGLDGSPRHDTMVRLARLPSVAQLFAENLDVPLELRPPGNKLVNVPLGLCMREAVALAGQLTEALGNAPPFQDRHGSVFSCYGTAHGGRHVSKAEFLGHGSPGGLPPAHLAWCRDAPLEGSPGPMAATQAQAQAQARRRIEESPPAPQGKPPPSSDNRRPAARRPSRPRVRRPNEGRSPNAALRAAMMDAAMTQRWEEGRQEEEEEEEAVGARCGGGFGGEGFEARRARDFWRNASQFKFAFSPFGNG